MLYSEIESLMKNLPEDPDAALIIMKRCFPLGSHWKCTHGCITGNWYPVVVLGYNKRKKKIGLRQCGRGLKSKLVSYDKLKEISQQEKEKYGYRW